MPAAMTCMAVRSLIVPLPPANRQACFLTCWLKISAGKSVEFSKLHKILYFSFWLPFFFFDDDSTAAKSMQILFCFPLSRFCYFESSTLFPCDMLSQHIWEASTLLRGDGWDISSSHVCFAALCKGIPGINNISQFSFRDYNRKAFNSLHVIASPVLQLISLLDDNVPSSASKCTI